MLTRNQMTGEPVSSANTIDLDRYTPHVLWSLLTLASLSAVYFVTSWVVTERRDNEARIALSRMGVILTRSKLTTSVERTLTNSQTIELVDILNAVDAGDTVLVVDPAEATSETSAIYAKIRKLRCLMIHGRQVTDRSIEPLTSCASLAFLDLFDTSVTDKAVETIAAIPNLQRISIDYSDVTEAGAKRLKELRPEIEIRINNPREIATSR